MDATSIIGIGASIFTATSLLPQLFKLLREKKAEGISVGMLTVLLTGLALWVWYGVRKEDLIIIIANSFSLAVNITTLILTLKYKKRNTSNK